MQESEDLLVAFLRAMGAASLCALIFVPFPYRWMDAVHRRLGMGKLPDAPVVMYLARSTSIFYGIFGALLWMISFDVHHHRDLLVFVAGTYLFMGLALTVVDWVESMPRFWKLGEGPIVFALGLLTLWLTLSLGPD